MFAVVHCPDFYIQCERLFSPELNGQALVIASSNNNGGTRLIASSAEAQSLGLTHELDCIEFTDICSALTTSKSIKLCSPNYELYADLSTRFIKSLELLAPNLSVTAHDKAILNLENLKSNNSLEAFGKTIRDKLKLWLGVSVLVGIAPTKTLAKLACTAAQAFEEYQGVVDLNGSVDRQTILKRMPIANISGISEKAANRLNKISIYNAFELSEAPKEQIRRHSNSVITERIALELSGLCCIDKGCTEHTYKQRNVNLDGHANQKSTIHATHTQVEARTFSEIKRALNMQVINATEYLANIAYSCKAITVTLTTASLHQHAPFIKSTPTHEFANELRVELDKSSHSASAIQTLSNQLLESLWQYDYQYHSLKLSLENLSPIKSDQFALFSSAVPKLKSTNENTLLQRINIETTLCAAEPHNSHHKRTLSSPFFTTRWGDIPRVS